MSVGERLKIFMVELKLNQTQFSNSIGLTGASLSNLLNSDAIPKTETLLKVANAYPNLSLHWLITGKGPKLLDGSQQSVAANAIGNGNTATATMHHNDCEKELAAARREIELLNARLRDKEELIEMLKSKS